MIILIAIIELSFASSTCTDYDKGKDPLIASSTLTKIENCQSTSCLNSQIIDRDTCINETEVLEYYCKAGFSESISLKCPGKTFCKEGACK